MTEPRLEVEADLVCPKCQGHPFRLYRRETKPESGIFTHQLWPTDPSIPPPVSVSQILCPTCRVECRRAAP